MSSPPSSSSSTGAFEQLHPKIQEWIWAQRWTQLRPAQELAIPPILSAETDVIISAATASGKTEAAWLPICSRLAFDAEAGSALPGIKAIYLSPLKALINDQYERLLSLCERAEIPVTRRHGDVTGAERKALLEKPDGVLLVTPESLEALFVLHGTRIPALFRGLRYVVIDELHSFIGIERGAQLQSLMHRLDLAVRKRIPRIGLSATLADRSIAADFLRPGKGEDVHLIGSAADDRAELQLILRGYIARSMTRATEATDATFDEEEAVRGTDARRAIAENLFKHMRGHDNLVFANSRGLVELYSDLLSSMCEEQRVPNEFYAHHGSLAKEHREDVENKLKSAETSATAICTSTLEMGIDIGSADAIGQVGAPTSVAALRQRVGRSGRRGKPAVLRMYAIEDELTEHSSIADQLREDFFQAVAIIELLLEKWYEPPNVANLHFSTLVQQVLSVIAQHGGASAQQLYQTLCSHGPFARITRDQFIELLRALGKNEVLTQASDGLLLHGKIGETIVNHYDFYAAFQSSQDFRVVCGGRTLGTMPVDLAVTVNSNVIFSGRRWKVVGIDEDARVIEVVRSSGGAPPRFGGGAGLVADGIRRKMRDLYLSADVPRYLSAASQQLLAEGRTAFKRFRFDASPYLDLGNTTLLVPWRGDLILNTLTVLLEHHGVAVTNHRIMLECNGVSPNELRDRLRAIAAAPMPSGPDLARPIKNKVEEKYDHLIGDTLINDAYASRNLDLPGAFDAIGRLLNG